MSYRYSIICSHGEDLKNDPLFSLLFCGLGDVLYFDIPESKLETFETFDPEHETPYFVFGCKYTRTGAARYIYGLKAEAAEFMAVIEELLDSDL